MQSHPMTLYQAFPVIKIYRKVGSREVRKITTLVNYGLSYYFHYLSKKNYFFAFAIHSQCGDDELKILGLNPVENNYM